MEADQYALWRELYSAELAHKDAINNNGQLLINVSALEFAAIFFLASDAENSVRIFQLAFYATLIAATLLAAIAAMIVVYGFQRAKTAYINNARELADFYEGLQIHDAASAPQGFQNFLSTRYRDVASLNAARNDTRSNIFFIAKNFMIASLLCLLVSACAFLGNKINWSVFNVCG